MVVSTDSLWEYLTELLEQEYREAVVYVDAEREAVLHEGPARVLATGWVELPSGRLLSPAAVHHIDTE
ncbi:hypothetical protein SAMN04487948_102351 [Halogranum amylolyticum]|uniref:Uncharacterized protein n=1 Tax=Halogranum amylolyticum TaxID=660520 RepID=A0A1H8PJK4_9EURY|nr:hypothetical protein [Halogranum amylolyticum]SEO42209.1 hypothetical protein SAMN04487948_102351 [Halogranum amylolyticum]